MRLSEFREERIRQFIYDRDEATTPERKDELEERIIAQVRALYEMAYKQGWADLKREILEVTEL